MQGATYHWRVVATNALGVTASPDQTFTVPAIYAPGDLDQTFTVPAIYAPGDLNGDGVVDGSELNTVLANDWPTSPWLQMTNVAGLVGTNVTFALTNDLTGTFSVEASTNLADWLLLGLALPRYEFTDTNAPDQPQRYYHLRWP